MHGDLLVQVTVTAAEMGIYSEANQKDALGEKVREAVCDVLTIGRHEVQFVWVTAEALVGDVGADVKITIYPGGTFDTVRNVRIDLLRKVLGVCEGLRDVFPRGRQIRAHVQVVRDVLFGLRNGAAGFLPEKRW